MPDDEPNPMSNTSERVPRNPSRKRESTEFFTAEPSKSGDIGQCEFANARRKQLKVMLTDDVKSSQHMDTYDDKAVQAAETHIANVSPETSDAARKFAKEALGFIELHQFADGFSRSLKTKETSTQTMTVAAKPKLLHDSESADSKATADIRNGLNLAKYPIFPNFSWDCNGDCIFDLNPLRPDPKQITNDDIEYAVMWLTGLNTAQRELSPELTTQNNHLLWAWANSDEASEEIGREFTA